MAAVLLCSCRGSSGFSGGGSVFPGKASNTAKRPLCPKRTEERTADSSRDRRFVLRLHWKTWWQTWEKATGDNLDGVALSPWRGLFEELHWFFHFDLATVRHFTPQLSSMKPNEVIRTWVIFLMTYRHVWPTQTRRYRHEWLVTKRCCGTSGCAPPIISTNMFCKFFLVFICILDGVLDAVIHADGRPCPLR